MRTQELHRLRDERARHLQQLEELEDTRNRLAKMQAKVEDLQAQLETKAKVERYLIHFVIMQWMRDHATRIFLQTTFPGEVEPGELLRGGVAHEGAHDATSGGAAVEDQEQDGAAHQAGHDARGHREAELAGDRHERHAIQGLEQERQLQLQRLFQVSLQLRPWK